MIILALDALDIYMVKKFRCKYLMQTEYGKTDIKEFEKERTVVLWASFLTGRNMEKEIPVKTQWSFKLSPEQTFLKFFQKCKTIDVPTLSYKDETHRIERELLKGYFEDKNTIEELDEVVWKNHYKNRKEFLTNLGKYELLMGYFNLADLVGHLNFGISEKMEEVYRELESLAKETSSASDLILIISDHGMKAVGRYGDHTKYGFYSLNQKKSLKNPRITSFYNLIRSWKNEK